MSQPGEPSRESAELDRPSGARVYDFFLGGGSNFAADRELARNVLAAAPDARAHALANRACVHRVVRMCVALGVRQFLDLGCGIPTAGNPHETAQSLDPDASVVYVDNEPIAAAQGELLLSGTRNVAMVRADLRDVDRVLDTSSTSELLDFRRPIAILLFSVMHFIPDADDPARLLRRYIDALPAGSYLALSHLTADYAPDQIHAILEHYRDSQHPGTPRTGTRLRELLDGLQLESPGIVPVEDWRPDSGQLVPRPSHPLAYLAVARKP